MFLDVFIYLLINIEPEMVQMWPLVIQDTLYMLIEDKVSLKESSGYDEFIRD
jgi:hypothetical protein